VISRNTRKTLSIFLLAMVMSACRQSAQKPVTLSYFRLGWAHANVWSAEALFYQAEFEERRVRRLIGINRPVEAERSGTSLAVGLHLRLTLRSAAF
jgi:hypothetical protein